MADDEPGVVRVLTRCLTSWGYEVIGAKDGLEAWNVLKEPGSPRIVILDWDMPGLSGIQVCRMTRQAAWGEETYVLLLTGRQQKTDLIEALEAGADDFISKPFEIRELQLRLARGVSTRERRASTIRPTNGPPPSGATLGGKFRLEKKIAEGGMASVWLGVHLSLGINVAVKLMKPEFTKTADYSSFEREARAAAQLRSPHIVRVYDHGLTLTGTPYLVMEYLSGECLWDRLDREGPLSPQGSIALVSQLASALAEAHAQGIIHRDVKPENIILVDDATNAAGFVAKLVDFGLARPDWRETTEASVAGTPSYMSPEHLRGEAALNPLFDLWALAVTAFSAMTGAVVFDGSSIADVIRAVCAGPTVVPSSYQPAVPAAVDDWFLRACAQDPASRFPTADAFAAAFADAWSGASQAPHVGNAGQDPSVSNPDQAPRASVVRDHMTSLAPTEPSLASFTIPESKRTI